MAVIVADSDVLIDFLRNNERADRVRDLLMRGNLCTTVITSFELLFGVKSKKQLLAIESLLESLLVFELTDESAAQGAEIARNLEKQGQRIGMADYLIAGICLEREAKLLTNNRKHFERVVGLTLA